MDNEHLAKAFAHPAVYLALKKALNDIYNDCIYLSQWGAGPAYSGRSSERDALIDALMACEQLLKARA